MIYASYFNFLHVFSVMDELPSTSTDFIVIDSQRGGKVLLLNGYRYNMRRVNNNEHTVWRCVKVKCTGSLVTNVTAVIKQQTHNCVPDVAGNEIKRQLNLCVQRVIKEITPVPSIYSDVLEEMKDADHETLQKLPKYNNIKKTLYKHRHKALQTDKVRFFKMKDVVIPGQFQNFLFADYCDKKTRILLFASEEGREILKQAKEFYCDGTFKSAVPPFSQLYTIHADLGSTNDQNMNIIPVLYALLPNKKQSTYEIMLHLIKSQIVEFQPNLFITDFEFSALAAIRKVFPESKSRGCLFHFSQAVWRKAKQIGLTKSKVCKTHIKRCIALAYLPRELKSDGWLYILGECMQNDKKIAKFNQYFESTWLKPSACLTDTWCFHDVPYKTNNVCESWNSRHNKKIKTKPNIAVLLKTLTKDSSYYFTFWKKNKFITKRTNEAILQQKMIENAIRELVDHEISLGHCLEKLK